MSATIVATAGSASANSYITLEDAETYFETHQDSETWDDATEDQKNRALIAATRYLDSYFTWKGCAAGSTQALLWPRVGVVGPNGYLLPATTIPTRIAQAACEWAQTLLESDSSSTDSTSIAGLTSLKVGSVSMDFGSSGLTVTSEDVPDIVSRLVAVLSDGRTGFGAVTMRRG